MDLHAEDKPNTCKVCGANFAQKSHLKRHIKIHTGEKPYKCAECGADFTDGSNFKRHARIHNGEKPYKCDTCVAVFSRKSELKKHTRIHTGEKPLLCCKVYIFIILIIYENKMVPMQRLLPLGLLALILNTGMSSLDGFHCLFFYLYFFTMCDIFFSMRVPAHPICICVLQSCTIIMDLHAEDKPNTCKVCGAYFSQKSHLKRHMKIHTGEKPYKCAECGADIYRWK
ncbi:zinc finger protein 45-like [Mya arenaria]|uniref:zinc finger protein 45-like n=1 Tax=Mya arenaria TaxID=6604 RepID=UPI0022E3126A|nr:zinc finger protein 45-like [Mya arenaria]